MSASLRVFFSCLLPALIVTGAAAAMVVQCCHASQRTHSARGGSLLIRVTLNLLPKWAAFGLVTSVLEAQSYQYQLRLFEGPLLPQVCQFDLLWLTVRRALWYLYD